MLRVPAKLKIGVGLATFVLAFTVMGCGSDTQTPPPQVAVVVLKPQKVEVTEDFPGRVNAVRVAEIRAQVGGIVQRRLFEQGAEVKANQPLYQINAAPFRADADVASAALKRAEAELSKAADQAARMERLLQANAISAQAHDEAVAARKQALADVAQTRATLQRRQLDLKFATVDAPIDGRIDQAMITEGALVGPSDATPMARIQQIDKVYVDIRVPTSSAQALRRTTTDGKAGGAAAAILRDNGEPYPISGQILFSGISVDAGTGDVLLRILADNKDHAFLPGMFVRARLPVASYANALLVPQQAVTFTSGKTFVWVIDAKNSAHQLSVRIGELADNSYRIVSGLKPGDKVVVEGGERLSDGLAVVPQIWAVKTASAQH
ncbi:multidrug efflux system membrane fusion protein [Rhizomicrobium palustre]|uniref:Multidrug efflux system membrane fusion protein n=1 Tax=Rhizomicrobium palustre TaxID=189966 RepID=A0A846MUT1_9PROT|nr:efflux RND transporter periplasmic adaptor subunit [Rhizomicrobium palustre]NIK87116.1 multidrug efflux system membrane fusion protein [Rhizomicrobium palustre]